MTMNVSAAPKDGDRIHFWMMDGRGEGLIHCRVTYVANRPCHEVTGCDVGDGVPYMDEWYHEQRYVPTEPSWRGTGRSRTDVLVKMVERSYTAAGVPIYETFDIARAALSARLEDASTQARRESERLARIRDRLPTTPTPEC